ncbi:uncharacterized protein LOC113790970 [Dermatophagoides pteronyssinus]|uniref:Uncharacterized protein LOC113790970 n=1 Tax=Dermatophagoides pteronyssinus TaxID=6956 RepID=A0A6P6XUH7_DERPT|nr:uncharacterized protein LOC113790970 [Dermatophagoides pteronyssinus]
MSYIMSHSKHLFTSQNFINCAFYSALASLIPFLNVHLSELGLSWSQCAWINCMSALLSMIGPLCFGPLAHKLSGYKQTLILTMILAFLSVTALLFIPKVISNEHTPKMYFDCNENVLRIEQCSNWNGQCHTYPKRPATNFSSFEIVTCSYVCNDDGRHKINSSWYPVNVCFHDSNDPVSLCLDVQQEKIIRTDLSLSQEASIQFDSRFDRWPVIENDQQNDLVDRMFDGQSTCTFKPSPPLLMLQKVYNNIQCRPYVPNCNIYCSINLRHRTIGTTRVRPPTPCRMIEGNPEQTFYLYLLFRCLIDLTLLTSNSLIEAIRVANTNNYDSIYAGFERFWTIILPFIVWPPICGILSDYFNEKNADNYAPPIIIFDGFIAITMFLIIMLPLNSTQTKESTGKINSKKLVVLQPTKFRYPRRHSNQYLLYRLAILIPMVLILGCFWGLSNTLTGSFYRHSLHSSNFLIGFATSGSFLITALFAYMAKSMISGIGRMNLILLAFIFYSLRFGGISFLATAKYQHKNWLILPFEMMSSFCLPLAWIGVTAYGQHLIKRSPNGLSYATGTTIFQTYSPHVIMQYTLCLIHFGGGRALGAAMANIWLNLWPDIYNQWLWLTDFEMKTIDNYTIESISNDDNAARILFRFSSILSLIFGLIFTCIYYSCCLNFLIKRNDPNSSLTSIFGDHSSHNHHHNDRNNHHYLKLKCKSENEVYPLRNHHHHQRIRSNSKTSDQLQTPAPITRSMVTLRENLESSVDDDDNDHHHRNPDSI